MAEPAVVDASPLIYLARGGCLDLLQLVSAQILVPTSVDQELRRRGQNDPAVQAMDQSPWLLTVADLPIPPIIQARDLGAGESAVLAWAQAHPGAEALIDDLAARRCAAAVGVPVRGTLGIVLAASPGAPGSLFHQANTKIPLPNPIPNRASFICPEMPKKTHVSPTLTAK